MASEPWADAPLSTCCRMPLNPLAAHDVADVDVFAAGPDVLELICLECGKTWTEHDLRVVAQAWWAAGAWAGKLRVEAGDGE